MAKAANIKIKLLSSADTGFFYVTSKNSRTKTEKLTFRKAQLTYLETMATNVCTTLSCA